MVKGFWKKLPRPFFALAPMADVTDSPFRHMIAKYGKPDVMWTEFVSCDGMCSVGREEIGKRLVYEKNERPIVAQIFGANPENVYKCTQYICGLGFDGIDINMGCPEKSIQRQGAGASLIQTPLLAQEVIHAAREGVRAAKSKIPVSVKTRIGYHRDTLEEWLPFLIEAQPAAITIHGRTKKEMSKVSTHWDRIGTASEMIHASGDISHRPLIIGNGDIRTLQEGREKAALYNLDGIMVGRGVFGKPWFFNTEYEHIKMSLEERFAIMIEHAHLFRKYFPAESAFNIMKKHFKAYVSDFKGAKQLRVALMQAHDVADIETTIQSFLGNKKY
ncbi:MAG: tRNA-dihydrouridine synthase [bacterium]